MLSGCVPRGVCTAGELQALTHTSSISGVRAGLRVWACLSTFSCDAPGKKKKKPTNYQVYSICLFSWLCFRSIPSFHPVPLSRSPEHMSRRLLSEPHTHPRNQIKKRKRSTAEARFNCPGGGKLNKAVKEKFLPLPFHLNL